MYSESDVKKILDRTDDGLKVFVHYLGKGCQNRTFRNPYRDDEHPSCRLYYHLRRVGGGKWYFHDYGDSDWHGDCFWFVSRICGISLQSSFRDVLHVIDRDLNIFALDDTRDAKCSYTMMPKKEIEGTSFVNSKIVRFAPEFKLFSKHELAYWGKYGITEEWLSKMNVRSVRHCTYTRADGSIFEEGGTYDNPVFAYTFPASCDISSEIHENGVKGMKLYRPNSYSKSRFMYVGQLPRPYTFGVRDYITPSGKSPGGTVYVTGGEKDVLSLLSHGFDAVCFNSETAAIPTAVMGQLAKSYDHVVFLYDSDATGIKESSARVDAFKPLYPNVSRVVLPLKGTKEEKDISDFFRSGHSSEELRQLTFDSLSTNVSNNNRKDDYENIEDNHSLHSEQARKCLRL